MKKKVIINNENETCELANKLEALKFENMVVCLDGDLGSGKTFFSKCFAKALNVDEVVTSPTFTIIKEYIGKMLFFHIDVYRLNGVIDGLGLDEYYNKNGIVFIEWASTILEDLPDERLEINIKRIDDFKREFSLTSFGDKYDKLLGELL